MTTMRIGDRVRVLRFSTMTPTHHSVTGIIEDASEGWVLLHELEGTLEGEDIRVVGLPGVAVRPQDIISLDDFAQLN
jgi:hypothetical protein